MGVINNMKESNNFGSAVMIQMKSSKVSVMVHYSCPYRAVALMVAIKDMNCNRKLAIASELLKGKQGESWYMYKIN